MGYRPGGRLHESVYAAGPCADIELACDDRANAAGSMGVLVSAKLYDLIKGRSSMMIFPWLSMAEKAAPVIAPLASFGSFTRTILNLYPAGTLQPGPAPLRAGRAD